MHDLPQAAVDAAMHARDESQSMTDEGLARDMLAAAAPILVADALKSAAREKFEAAIAEAAEEATTARLHEIEAAVRASERERIIALARRKRAVYCIPCDGKPCEYDDELGSFADLLREGGDG